MPSAPNIPATRVIAIHPHSGEIEDAFLLSGYFGNDKDAIIFMGLNQPRWDADTISYEVICEKV